MDELRAPSSTFEHFALSVAIFGDGDRNQADSSAGNLSRGVARDTSRIQGPDAVRRLGLAMVLLALWPIYQGDTAPSRAPVEWLRRHTEANPANHVFSILPEMLVASRARRVEAAALRSFVDSVTLEGCCTLPEFGIPLLAQSYEAGGDDAGALQVFRRAKWYWPPRNLSALLRDEGRLAARLGDRVGAIRAYEHYLALRSDPEPVLRPKRDRIRAELNRLKRGR